MCDAEKNTLQISRLNRSSAGFSTTNSSSFGLDRARAAPVQSLSMIDTRGWEIRVFTPENLPCEG